jgi:hypothetical protein
MSTTTAIEIAPRHVDASLGNVFVKRSNDAGENKHTSSARTLALVVPSCARAPLARSARSDVPHHSSASATNAPTHADDAHANVDGHAREQRAPTRARRPRACAPIAPIARAA